MIHRCSLLITVAIGCTFAGLIMCFAKDEVLGAAPPAGIVTPRVVQRLISSLGSESQQERELATQRLMTMPAAIEAVRVATQSADLEIGKRASIVLDHFLRNRRKTMLQRALVAVKNGAIDAAVEIIVGMAPDDTSAEEWEVLVEFTQRIATLEHERIGRLKSSQGHSYFSTKILSRHHRPYQLFIADERTLPGKTSSHFLIGAAGVRLSRLISQSLIVSSEPVICTSTVSHSFILSSKDVKVEELRNSIVICDGDFRADAGMSQSLIIANGSVQCPNGMYDCVIISGRQFDAAKCLSRRRTVLIEDERSPFGVIRWFSPDSVGISVRGGAKGILVDKVEKGKPFHTAGLRRHDQLLSIDGLSLTAPAAGIVRTDPRELFRRHLRKRFAEGGNIVIRYSRYDNEIEEAIVKTDE